LSLNNFKGDFGDFGDFYESSKGVALGYINLVPKGALKPSPFGAYY